jgi:hypothetical protein
MYACIFCLCVRAICTLSRAQYIVNHVVLLRILHDAHVRYRCVWERAEGPGTGPAGGASDPSGGTGKRQLGVVWREKQKPQTKPTHAKRNRKGKKRKKLTLPDRTRCTSAGQMLREHPNLQRQKDLQSRENLLCRSRKTAEGGVLG